jgi:hypothetical protein
MNARKHQARGRSKARSKDSADWPLPPLSVPIAACVAFTNRTLLAEVVALVQREIGRHSEPDASSGLETIADKLRSVMRMLDGVDIGLRSMAEQAEAS